MRLASTAPAGPTRVVSDCIGTPYHFDVRIVTNSYGLSLNMRTVVMFTTWMDIKVCLSEASREATDPGSGRPSACLVPRRSSEWALVPPTTWYIATNGRG